MRFFRRVLVVLLVLGVLAGLTAAGGAYYFYGLLSEDLPSLETLEDYEPALASTVLDRRGRLIGQFFEERRRIIPRAEIPQEVVEAFVAAEDDSFFRHSGVDYISILRAAWVNFQAGGKIKQGASTITQQVAKGLVGNEKSYTRKLREMLLAKRIEDRFSKDEILYLYLNQIYFGHGAYGILEAARSYFGKRPAELTVSEAALLAGLPKAPTDYSPTVNPDAAEQRRLYVLGRMQEQRFIDRSEYDAAVAEKPIIRDPADYADFAVAAGFTEEVRRALYQKLGSARTLRGGLVIETTLDLELQRAAVLALQRGLESYDRRHGGWRGPERQVAPSEIAATAAEIARQNALLPLTRGQATPEPPVNRSLVGVVREVGHDEARVLVAPDVEIRVGLPESAWAFKPRWKDDGSDARGLDRLLRAGDVARFVLRPAPVPVSKPETPAPSAIPEPPSEDEEGEEGPESVGVGTLPAVSAGPGEPPPLRWELHQVPSVQGALLSLDVAQSGVLAMVGGYEFARSEFNRVTQAMRQPGSAFKLFLYGASLEAGWVPTSTVMDSPITVWDQGSMQYWSPKNYKNIYKGAVPMKEAVARSLNNAAIHVFLDVGVDPTIDYARRLGIRSPMGRHLSLSLGSTEMSLAELVRAYGTVAAGGKLLQPVYITRVLDRTGKPLLQNVVLDDLDAKLPAPTQNVNAGAPTQNVGTGAPTQNVSAPAPAAVATAATAEGGAEPAPFVMPTEGLPPDEAYLMTYLLRQPVDHQSGTAHKAAELGRPLAGKTGTTNEQNDAWFIGFSPEIATGVWVGFDQKKMLGDKETGGRAALPIWIDYMNVALRDVPPNDFLVPEGIEFRRVGGTQVTSGGMGEDGEMVEEVVRVLPVSWEPFLTRKVPRKLRASVPSEEDEEGETDTYDLLRDEAF